MLEKIHMTPLKGEPVRALRTPFGFVESMLSEVENLWQRPLFRPMTRRLDKEMSWMPTFDVYALNGKLMVKADLPGLKKEDIHIYLEDGALVLQGERKEEKKVEKESYFCAECNYGSFYRRLPLSFEVDFNKIAAKFADGVLEVEVPMPALEPSKTQEVPLN